MNLPQQRGWPFTHPFSPEAIASQKVASLLHKQESVPRALAPLSQNSSVCLPEPEHSNDTDNPRKHESLICCFSSLHSSISSNKMYMRQPPLLLQRELFLNNGFEYVGSTQVSSSNPLLQVHRVMERSSH